MGQHYKAIILEDNKKTIKSYGSPFDYNNSGKLMTHSYLNNNFVARIEAELLNNPQRLVWAGDYAALEKNGRNTNLHLMCADVNKLAFKDISADEAGCYIVNHDKKVYIYIGSLKDGDIHPLPLLTAEGNGIGGGDYFGDQTHVGTWARDIISTEYALGDYSDYEQLDISFVEDLVPS